MLVYYQFYLYFPAALSLSHVSLLADVSPTSHPCATPRSRISHSLSPSLSLSHVSLLPILFVFSRSSLSLSHVNFLAILFVFFVTFVESEHMAYFSPF
jgi:hypothetical protein